jgi:HKD family nuclease
MQLTFINQPFEGEGHRVGDHLVELLNRFDDFDRLRVAVAWTKSGGIRPIFEAMQQFRAKGGRIEAVVGIDLNGTSIQALKMLLQVAHKVMLFQNANRYLRPTYHPKLYVFSGSKLATAILGSSNLTMGGLYVNYEQNLRLDLDLTNAADKAVLGDIEKGYQASVDAQNGVVRLLTEELLGKLVERGLLLDEDAVVAPRARTGDQDSDATKATVAPLFGAMAIPPPPARARKPAATSIRRPGSAKPVVPPASALAAAPVEPGLAASAPSAPNILNMRPYPQRGDTQIQVPQDLATTFFRGIKYVESQYDERQHPISPARTKSRSGSRAGRVVNTLKLEIPECKGKAVPVIQFQKTGGTIEYSVFDGVADLQGRMILQSLEDGLRSGETKRTRPGSTMWAEF